MHCGRFSFFTASAQLKVSTAGNMSVGVTLNAASTLSVGGTGSDSYAAYVNDKGKVTDDIIGTTYHPQSRACCI